MHSTHLSAPRRGAGATTNAGIARHNTRPRRAVRPPRPAAAAGGGGSPDAYDPFAAPPSTGPPPPQLTGPSARRLGPDPGSDPYWTASASVEDDGVLAEASRTPPSSHHSHHPHPHPSSSTLPAGGASSSPLSPDDALLAAAPGTQAARLRDLQAAAAARRDVHWAMYRAHSAKANLLATAVLLTTTAGGTSGLVSLVGGGGGGGGMPPQMVAGPPGWTYSPQVQGGGGGGGGGGWSGGASSNPYTATSPFSSFSPPPAPPLGSAVQPPPPPSPSTAALLTPILGFASTVFSGFQSYSKPSTAASRHLTAFKRYQLLARHARDALAYGRSASLGRVIQAVERKIDQYCDESPVIGLGSDPVEGAGSGDGGQYPPPPGPGRAFWVALTELPE